jgi:hypothetical protein
MTSGQAVAVNSNATKPILRVEEKALRREDMLQRSTILVLFTAKPAAKMNFKQQVTVS